MRHASQTNHIHPLAVKNVIAILWGYWLECYDSIASSLLIACPRFYEFISITLCSHSRHFPLSDDTYFSYYMWNRGCIVHKQRYLCRCQPNTIASACETNVPYTNLYIYISFMGTQLPHPFRAMCCRSFSEEKNWLCYRCRLSANLHNQFKRNCVNAHCEHHDTQRCYQRARWYTSFSQAQMRSISMSI